MNNDEMADGINQTYIRKKAKRNNIRLLKRIFIISKRWIFLFIFLLINFSPFSIFGNNILENNNPGFESSTSLEFWKELGTASSITRSPTYSHSGTYSCKFDNPTSSFSGRGIISTNYSTLSITGGSNYRGGAWFYVNHSGGSIGSSKLYLGLVWLNSSYSPISTNAKIFTNTAFNTWQYHYIKASAPSTANYVQLLIQVREIVNNNNDIYVDDTEIWEIGQGCGVYSPGSHPHWDGENNWTLDYYNEFTVDRMPPGFCKIVVNPKDGDEFKLVKNNWGNSSEWSAGYWINEYNKVWTIPRNDQGNNNNARWISPPKEFITIVSITNPNNTQEKFGFLATSDYPVYIENVTAITGKIDPNTPQHISITLSKSKSPEEKVFIRYTTNNWSSSSLIEAEMSNSTIYTCSLPGFPRNTTVKYYALTTTTNTLTDIDYLTLSVENNNGNNYQFQIYNLGNCWHIPSNNEPSGHTMREPLEPAAGNSGYFYNGNQFQGAGITGDQSGGIIYWRKKGSPTWNSNNFSYFSTEGNNKYWRAIVSFPSSWTNGEVIQYYIKVLYTDRETTYIYTNNQLTGNRSIASSNPYEFVLNIPPKVTNLINPPDGEVNYYSRRPKFKWSPAYDTDGDSIQNYHIWIDDNPDFSSPVVDTDINTNNPWYQITTTLNLNITYYWRVTAYDGHGWGPYSKTNSFKINPPFITVDGTNDDWGQSVWGSHTNICQISNGIWMWKDPNQNWSGSGNDVRTPAGFDWGNCEIQEFKVTADTNVLFFYFKFLNLTSGGLAYICITIDTDQINGSGKSYFAGNSETTVNPDADWEKQIVVTLDKTGIYDTNWNWTECGESWFNENNEIVEIGMPWEDLGITLPARLRFEVAVGYKDTTDQMKDPDTTNPGSRVLDAITRFGPNTWDEVNDGNVWHYFDVVFRKFPYNDTHGGHTGVVWPEHLDIKASRSSTKPGIEFSLTNSAHSFNCGCIECQLHNGSLVKDYNGPILYMLTPTPSGELLKAKTNGFVGGRLIENVILNQVGNPVNIKIQDKNVTSLTASINITSTRPEIYINEINFIPVGADDNKEWVEIYSKENETLNLTNWYITDEDGGGYRITKNVHINQGNFLVIYDGTGTDDTNFSDNRGSLYGDWGSAILTPTDDNSTLGDELSLYCSYGNMNPNTIIDFVAWDGDGTPTSLSDQANATNAGIWTNGKVVLTSDANIDEGNTLALLPCGDDNNSPSDWVARAVPTPGYSNYLHPVIQEIGNAPPTEYWDYIEIFNPAPYPIDISGWALCDPTSSELRPRTFPAGTVIASNGFILCTRNADAFYSKFKFYPDFEWFTTGDPGSDNPDVPNLGNESYLISIVNNDTLFLVGTNYLSADVSIDEIVTGTGDGGTNFFPEGRWRGNNAPALNTSQALRRLPEGKEGTEDDDNVSTDSDISAENNEDLSTIFKLTNWDPNCDDVYYVSWSKGDDTRTPFQARHIDTPWKTIQHAHDNMIPGDTALVLPGTNYENILITTSGTPQSNITYSGYSNNSYVNGKSNEYSLKLQNANFIKIKKLKVFNATNGIYILNSSHNEILDSTIFFNGFGLRINSGESNFIYGNSFYSNEFFATYPSGIFLDWNGNNNQIISNKIFNQKVGLKTFNGNNNTISNNIFLSATNQAIFIHLSTNNKIKNNKFTNNKYGVYFTTSANKNFLLNNTIYSSFNAIYVENASNNLISGNYINNSSDHSIVVIYNSYNNYLKYNTNYNSTWSGIRFDSVSLTNYVISNKCINGATGINLEYSTNIILMGNTLSSNSDHGIYLDRAHGNRIENNIAQENGNTGIYLLNYSRDNYISQNQTTGGAWCGLLIQNGINNKIYTNTVSHSPGRGIVIEFNSTNNTIKGNYVYTNSSYGIHLNGANITSSTIQNNIIYSNLTGILIQYAKDTVIEGNECYNNFKTWGVGIFVQNSPGNTYIYNNICTRQNNQGDGIKLEHSRNAVISNNYVSHYYYGSYLYHSTNIRFIDNTISSNGPYGLLIETSKSNTISGNIVFSNLNICIYVLNNSSYNIISNNTVFLSAGNDGIKVEKSGNNRLVDNTSYKNKGGAGITLIVPPVKNNYIYNNTTYSNFYGVYISDATNNTILSNDVFGNTNGIYILNNSLSNIIKKNRVKNSLKHGIQLYGVSFNRIIENTVLSNGDSYGGITCNDGANNNYIASNICAYNYIGIWLENITGCTLYRNAIFKHTSAGIYLNNADNCIIHHNSLASNATWNTVGGIYLYNNSDNNEIINTISAFSPGGYGIYLDSGSVVLKYNDVYGNSAGNYHNCSAGNGSISSDPLWLSYNIYSSNFLYISNTSPCFDAGTNLGYSYVGLAPDMGWKEYMRPFVKLNLSKSITNVTLGGNPEVPIPGAAIEYKINYEIITNLMQGSNLIIYDRIPVYTTYSTDYIGSGSGWIVEYSTNVSPDQSYNSADYSTTKPSKEQIKWIRWKKSVSGTESGVFYLTVIIK